MEFGLGFLLWLLSLCNFTPSGPVSTGTEPKHDAGRSHYRLASSQENLHAARY